MILKFKFSDSTYKKNESLKIFAYISMIFSYVFQMFFEKSFGLNLDIFACFSICVFSYYLAQGFENTSNYKKYLLRIWIFAIITQIPYTFLSNSVHLNVLFTFFISLLIMKTIQTKEYYWLPIILFIPITVQFVYSGFDYSFFGILLPVFFYLFKKNNSCIIVQTIIAVFYAIVSKNYGMIITPIVYAIIIYLPWDNLKIKINKYLFYWGYPLLLIVLDLIKIVYLTLQK